MPMICRFCSNPGSHENAITETSPDITVILTFCGGKRIPLTASRSCIQWIKHTLTASSGPLFIYSAVARLSVPLTAEGIWFMTTNQLNLVRPWGDWGEVRCGRGGGGSELLTDVKGEALRAVHSCHGEHVAPMRWESDSANARSSLDSLG